MIHVHVSGILFYRKKINNPTVTGAVVIPTPTQNNSPTDDDGKRSITIHEASGYEKLQVDNYRTVTGR